jgi:hypothetical protein
MKRKNPGNAINNVTVSSTVYALALLVFTIDTFVRAKISLKQVL